MTSLILRGILAGACLWVPAEAQITVTVSLDPVSRMRGHV